MGFIIGVAGFLAQIIGILYVTTRMRLLLNLANFINCPVSLATTVFFIMGAYWRFSDWGSLCSEDLLHNEGRAMKFYYYIFLAVIALACMCCCCSCCLGMAGISQQA